MIGDYQISHLITDSGIGYTHLVNVITVNWPLASGQPNEFVFFSTLTLNPKFNLFPLMDRYFSCETYFHEQFVPISITDHQH